MCPSPLFHLLPYLYVTSPDLMPRIKYDCRSIKANLTPPLEYNHQKRGRKRDEAEAKETATAGMRDE